MLLSFIGVWLLYWCVQSTALLRKSKQDIELDGRDFVLVDMFASYCTGREEAKGAIKIAERQLQRIYR